MKIVLITILLATLALIFAVGVWGVVHIIKGAVAAYRAERTR